MRLELKLIKQEIRNVVGVLLLAVFFSSGCSLSVPEPDENNQSLLIVPVETIQTLEKFIFTANLTIQDANNKKIFFRIEPNPKTLFSYKPFLNPGEYKITDLKLVAKPGFKFGNKKKKLRLRNWEALNVKLEKGKATIVNKRLLFQQPPQIKRNKNMRGMSPGEKALEKAMIKQRRKEVRKKLREVKFKPVEVHNLDESFQAKLLEQLKEVENSEKWEITVQQLLPKVSEKSSSTKNKVEQEGESEDY